MRTNKPRRIVNFLTTLAPACDNASPGRFNKSTEARNCRSHGTPVSASYYSRFMYIRCAYKAAIALLKPGGGDAEVFLAETSRLVDIVLIKQTGATSTALLHLAH